MMVGAKEGGGTEDSLRSLANQTFASTLIVVATFLGTLTRLSPSTGVPTALLP
jgi:hypothetical protein